MARPRKCRRICQMPRTTRFAPEDGGAGEICMSLDEFESIRLIDLEHLQQEECALRMNVARTTVQSIYLSARSKLAEALVAGKSLAHRGRGRSPVRAQRRLLPGRLQRALPLRRGGLRACAASPSGPGGLSASCAKKSTPVGVLFLSCRCGGSGARRPRDGRLRGGGCRPPFGTDPRRSAAPQRALRGLPRRTGGLRASCAKKKHPCRGYFQLVEKPAVAIKPEQVLCVQARPKKRKNIEIAAVFFP